MTNEALVVVRALHFGATLLAFGELVFVSFVASPLRKAAATTPLGGDPDRRVRAYTTWALAVSGLAMLAWLVLQAAEMAGTTIGQALDRDTLEIVLGQTEFGRVFVLRAALFVAIVVSLACSRRAPEGEMRRWRLRLAAVLAALYVAALAGAGHAAAATEGGIRVVHVGADAFHLLAAGGWLGALPALVRCFASDVPSVALAQVTRRFSVLGIFCVAALVATGAANALFLVGSFAALFGTPYGRLLVVKLAVFAAMIVLAAINRSRLMPRLAEERGAARRSLQRNATLETAGGIVIVAIVGALGTMIPGAHQSPIWPFPFTFDLSSEGITRASGKLLAIALVAVAAIVLVVVGTRRKATRLWIPGCVALLILTAASASLFAVPAFPTTYATSPVPYAAGAVARGATRFARECSGCHGAQARGDGPAGGALPGKPADLTAHALHHPQGNLFWWIAHGIPGTAMPAFSARIPDAEIWEIVQYLVTRASAVSALSLGPQVDPDSTSRLPDFAYEVPQQGQHTLAEERTPALIVLYSTAASTLRLAQLASDHRVLHGGVRVIALALPGSPRALDRSAILETIVGDDVASVFAMFADASAGKRAAHVEMLVDGAGIARARWTGTPAPNVDRDAEIVAAATRLPAVSSRPGAMHHGH